jgi:hypothetical protein
LITEERRGEIVKTKFDDKGQATGNEQSDKKDTVTEDRSAYDERIEEKSTAI